MEKRVAVRVSHMDGRAPTDVHGVYGHAHLQLRMVT